MEYFTFLKALFGNYRKETKKDAKRNKRQFNPQVKESFMNNNRSF